MSSDHFKGKTIPQHLLDARMRGAMASAEIHGIELPGHIAAGADAAKEMSIVFLLLWILFQEGPELWQVLVLFTVGYTLWKAGRSAFLGWSRLERLHRVIEEERFEIEHHRDQEREELKEMYRAKGFSGKLLDEVVEVLMADDNRLLKVMLEEELGLTLESYEHPLKQSIGAAVGALIAAVLGLASLQLNPEYGIPFLSILILSSATAITCKLEKNRILSSVIWTLSLTLLSCGAAFFISKLF